MLASTGLAPPSNRSRRAVPSNPLRISAELRSTRKGIGLLSIRRPAASFGISNVLRGYLWRTKFRIFSDHKVLESIGKVGNHNDRVQIWFEFLTAFDYTLEYRKGSANGNADFLSRLPEPATEHCRSGSTSLNPVGDGGIYLIRACGLSTPSSPIPGVG